MYVAFSNCFYMPATCYTDYIYNPAFCFVIFVSVKENINAYPEEYKAPLGKNALFHCSSKMKIAWTSCKAMMWHPNAGYLLSNVYEINYSEYYRSILIKNIHPLNYGHYCCYSISTQDNISYYSSTTLKNLENTK